MHAVFRRWILKFLRTVCYEPLSTRYERTFFFFLFMCATSQDLSLKKRREQLGFGAGNVCDMGSCLVITSF